MNAGDAISSYLSRQTDDRPLRAGRLAGVRCVIVIPCLAEMPGILETLASLAANPPCALAETLVLCVVNHRAGAGDEPAIRDNNRETLRVLGDLVAGRTPAGLPAADRIHGERILSGGIRLACLDAASEGCELPGREGGVGLARKLGMDAALRILHGSADAHGIIACLDADTTVEANYLAALRRAFRTPSIVGNVVSFAHRPAADPGVQAAICAYEILLRHYVLGIAWAGSRFAFHAIGSAMACSAQGYVAVRGMNRRQAGEDFHFLNQLAKTGVVGRIRETTVYPSPRPSRRVPFGTGPKICRYMAGDPEAHTLYDPAGFAVLRRWIAAAEGDPDRPGKALLADARGIHSELARFLAGNGFADAWDRIRANSRHGAFLHRQFAAWFDGLRTLKLVHHLRDHGFPRLPMFDALQAMYRLLGWEAPRHVAPGAIPEMAVRMEFLESLRRADARGDVADPCGSAVSPPPDRPAASP